MIRFLTENRPYSDDEVKQYVVEAIKQGEITFKIQNDEVEESPVMSDTILKGCRENALSQKKKSKLRKISDFVKEVSRDPEVKAAAKEKDDDKKKGRLASQSEMTVGENLSKSVRTVSPK